jgi:hypothetical protein
VGENFGIASRLFLNDAKPSRNKRISQSKEEEEEEEEEEKRETPFFSSCVHQQLLRTCSSKFSFLFFLSYFSWLWWFTPPGLLLSTHPNSLARSAASSAG